ncbi:MULTISPECIES: glycosyltransferase [unclassified Synechococcus]|nr:MULTISPECIES: glycosyltransferase [unclassified Synechococcus]TWB88554.1 glycosyl transferase family 8 [Synechococcus sp. Ace-Pa]
MEPIAKLSIPLMMKYAENIKSDFIRLSPRLANKFQGILNYEKFQIFNLFSYYERIIFLDADILIAPAAPSLFDVVDEEHLGVFIASRYSDLHNPSVEAILCILGEIAWQREARNPEIYESFNSGVLVCSRKTGEYFGKEMRPAEVWAKFDSHNCYMSDQTFMNYVAQKYSLALADIGYQFNHTLAPGKSSHRFRSHMIHYAGVSHREANWFNRPSKIAKMRSDHFILSKRSLSNLASSHPFLVRMIDHVL